ncbi:MAG: pchC [Nitrospira sp.]|nr:pchC [Nitrospira sp.]
MEKARAAFILASMLAVGMAAGAAWADSRQAPQQGFAWKDGAEVYKKVCALCHDTAVGPAVLGRGHDPLYIRLIVRNGSRAMPAFRASEIDDELLTKLAEYVSKTAADK